MPLHTKQLPWHVEVASFYLRYTPTFVLAAQQRRVSYRRWRTALIIRELEEEIVALEKGRPFRRKLKALLKKKEIIGAALLTPPAF